MQITDEFILDLPPQQTYDLLLDLERVAPCLPGAVLGEELDDGSRAIAVKVKLGPMRFTYDGVARIAEQDPAARRAVLTGSANEARGQGSASAAITMQVDEAAGASRVTAVADIELTGRAAQMGHGVVESVTRQLMGQMTRSLSDRFAVAEVATTGPSTSAQPSARPLSAQTAPTSTATAEPRPLRAGALVWAVLRERISALFRRPKRSTA